MYERYHRCGSGFPFDSIQAAVLNAKLPLLINTTLPTKCSQIYDGFKNKHIVAPAFAIFVTAMFFINIHYELDADRDGLMQHLLSKAFLCYLLPNTIALTESIRILDTRGEISSNKSVGKMISSNAY
jgi:hypothetical protein